MLHAPHGSLCAALLAPVLSVNAAALAARGRETPAFTRLAELARLLTGEQEATTADGIQWARSATHAAGIPGLSRWGATRADFARMVSAARAASSMKGNPVALSDAELTQVLELAL
jgi:alcohol dehydrogenase class IV